MTSNTFLKKILKTLGVSCLALSVLSAQALTISPARAEITGDPGETITDSFLLINEQNSDETFYTSVENFDSQGETGTPNFTNSKEGLPSWIKVTDKVVLKKGERIKRQNPINPDSMGKTFLLPQNNLSMKHDQLD